MKLADYHQKIIQMMVILISIMCTLILLFDFIKPSYYNNLFILPLSCAVLNMINGNLYKKIPQNIGVTIILLLMFFRLTVTPFFMVLGNYNVILNVNLGLNTSKAIILMAYEATVIYFVLIICSYTSKESIYTKVENISCNVNYKIKLSYKIILLILFIILITTFIIAPEQKMFYRTIIGIGEKYYTSLETSDVIEIYGTTFLKKGSMVLGMYLFKFLRILIPAVIIIENSNRFKGKISLIISIIIACTQFLFVEGAIARSFYYTFILLILITYLYKIDSMRFLEIIFILGVALVSIYFYIRYKTNKINYSNIFEYASRISNSYFSGVNVVSGIFNMPRTLELRIHYFFYDYFKSIPFGNTIFKLDSNVMQTLFNQANNSGGQIPPTVASSYYYFGILLSPLYSIIFTIISFTAGEKVSRTDNYISKVNYLLLSLIMALGIIMYNQSIAITTGITVILPMFIIKKLAYRIKC